MKFAFGLRDGGCIRLSIPVARGCWLSEFTEAHDGGFGAIFVEDFHTGEGQDDEKDGERV
jgi:hypothetical protein